MARLALATLAASAIVLSGPPAPTRALDATSPACGGAASPTTSRLRADVPRFRRVVLILFENHDFGQIIGNLSAPTFNALAHQYALLRAYCGVAHPSLPNYLALVSGSTHGITSDCTDCTVDGSSLADTLGAAGKTWKTYAEGLPAPGFTGAFAGRYAKKHNPFLYFRRVLARPDRRKRVVPLSAFAADLAHRRLPSFSLVVPDLCHDMHDCDPSVGDAWLNGFVKPLLQSNQLRGGAVFVVFDEGGDTIAGDNPVPALVLGPLVRAGASSAQPLTHYSLLRTIEEAWHLRLLGKSRGAQPITGIWR